MSPQKVPDTHKRLAADRPDGVQNFVYCPHASELSVSNPHRAMHVGYSPASNSMTEKSLGNILHSIS